MVALEDAVGTTAGEFLPHWDDLELAVNRGRGEAGDRGRGEAGDHGRNLRARLLDARATLLARLGSHYLAPKRGRARAGGSRRGV